MAASPPFIAALASRRMPLPPRAMEVATATRLSTAVSAGSVTVRKVWMSASEPVSAASAAARTPLPPSSHALTTLARGVSGSPNGSLPSPSGGGVSAHAAAGLRTRLEVVTTAVVAATAARTRRRLQ